MVQLVESIGLQILRAVMVFKVSLLGLLELRVLQAMTSMDSKMVQ